MFKKNYLFAIFILFITLSSLVVGVENQKTYDLSYVNLNDNIQSIFLTNNKQTPLNIKLSVLDSNNMIDIEFDDNNFELKGGESREVFYNFGITQEYIGLLESEFEYDFQILATPFKKSDNSILRLDNSGEKIIEPYINRVKFKVDVSNKGIIQVSNFIKSYYLYIFSCMFAFLLLIAVYYNIKLLSKSEGIKIRSKSKSNFDFKNLLIKLNKFIEGFKFQKNSKPKVVISQKSKKENIVKKESVVVNTPVSKQSYTDILENFMIINNNSYDLDKWFELVAYLKKQGYNYSIVKVKSDLDALKNGNSIKADSSTNVISEKVESKEDDSFNSMKERLKKLKQN